MLRKGSVIYVHTKGVFLPESTVLINWISPEGNLGYTYLTGVGNGLGQVITLRAVLPELPLGIYPIQTDNGGQKMELSVNPQGISSGDIISTHHGVSRVGWVNEEKGYLTYAPVSDPSDKVYSKEVPIRSVFLLSKSSPVRGEQLSLPFITEMVESAIMDRNRRLDEMRDETFSPKLSVRSTSSTKKKDTISTGDKELLNLLSKLSKEELEKLLN